jgi:hypothetical protein
MIPAIPVNISVDITLVNWWAQAPAITRADIFVNQSGVNVGAVTIGASISGTPILAALNAANAQIGTVQFNIYNQVDAVDIDWEPLPDPITNGLVRVGQFDGGRPQALVLDPTAGPALTASTAACFRADTSAKQTLACAP